MSTSRAKMKLETSPHKVVMMLLEEADGSKMNPEKKKIEKLIEKRRKKNAAKDRRWLPEARRGAY